MTKNRRITMIFLMILAISLAGCGPDPRNAADAYATTSKANTDAAAAGQQLQITADEHALQLDEAQQIQAEKVAAKQRLIKYGSVASVISLVICLGASTWVYLKILAPGLANAAVTATDLKARLILMDAKTMTYPAVVHYMPDGRATIILPDLTSVMLLDQPHEPNAQQIATQGQTKVIGLLANAAKKSDQAGTLAKLQAPVVSAMEVQEHGKGIRVYRTKEGVK